MTVGLSFEVTIPDHVDASAVIRIGERYSMDDLDEEMTLSDALQWAFKNPDAITALSALGVDWEVITTGRQ
jgi:hypothetical protein